MKNELIYARIVAKTPQGTLCIIDKNQKVHYIKKVVGLDIGDFVFGTIHYSLKDTGIYEFIFQRKVTHNQLQELLWKDWFQPYRKRRKDLAK